MIGYVDRTAGAVEYCENMVMNHPDGGGPIAEAYEKLSDYCKNKLWHQLTLLVMEMLENPEIYGRGGGGGNNTGAGGGGGGENDHSYLSLYDRVVLCVDTKLNPLSLAKIAALVAQSILSWDPTAAKAILENLLANNKKEKKEKDDSLTEPATIFLQSKLASLVLTTAPPEQSDFASLWTTFQTNKELLHHLPAEENSELAAVHAAHYESTLLYHKRLGPPEAFYEQALLYLQYMGPNFLKKTPSGLITPRQLAVDLILAALTGDGVYNLGQVEQTPVLLVLSDSPDAIWLVHLLQATAAGNVALFRQYQITYAPQIAAQPALVHRAAAVTEKLTLLALVTLVFSKPSQDRILTFPEIATALQLSNIDQVEWIVMRALSVHLLEGSIDQVQQQVTVTWVMPRVLNTTQMQQLALRFDDWATKVTTTQSSMNAAVA